MKFCAELKLKRFERLLLAPGVRGCTPTASSEFDEFSDEQDPPAPPPADGAGSRRTGEALRRMVSSINCLA